MASTSRMWERNLLPRPSPLLAPLHQTSDVHEFDGGGGELFGMIHLGQHVQPLVRHATTPTLGSMVQKG